MATTNSDQVTKILATSPRRLSPQDGGGKVMEITYTYTVPASGPVVGDIIQMAKLPNGSKVIDYWFGFGAMGAGATCDFGITGDGTRYLTTLAVAAAGEKRAAFVQDKMPDQTAISDDATYLIATVRGVSWANAIKFQGWVKVVLAGG